MKRWVFLLVLALMVPCLLFGAGAVDVLKEHLIEPNHLYGVRVAPEDLDGRLVLVWDIRDAVASTASTLSSNDSRDNDESSEARRDRRRSERDAESSDGSPSGKLKEEMRILRKAVKGALKDGRLLVIFTAPMPEMSEERRTHVDAIRRLKPAFGVYDLGEGAKTALYDAHGAEVVANISVRDLAEGERLTNALAEVADYIPGRMILFKTQSHESQSKLFVRGKNIEKPLMALKREAAGNNEKAAEAKRMCEAIQSTLEMMCAEIDADLERAPSCAVERIVQLQKTFPPAARKYQAMVGPLRNNVEVKQLAAARKFLGAANNGDVGRGDMGRNADSFLEKLKPISQSKNTAVSAEATALMAQLEKISSQALAAEDASAREKRVAQRKKESEERDARKKSEKADNSRGNNTRPTAWTVLSQVATGLEPLMEELIRLDDATCNYEALRNGYTKYEGQKGEKAEAAKVLIDTINSTRKGYEDALTAIQKEKTPFALFEKDWEDILTVNYPSLGTTPLGRASLKILRDSEVKRIYGALNDVQSGAPSRDEDQGSRRNSSRRQRSEEENPEIAAAQYKIAKLKNLQKYRKTSSALGKMCVVQLDALGFTEEGIKTQIESEETSLKELKKSQKEAEKRRKEEERNRED